MVVCTECGLPVELTTGSGRFVQYRGSRLELPATLPVRMCPNKHMRMNRAEVRRFSDAMEQLLAGSRTAHAMPPAAAMQLLLEYAARFEVSLKHAAATARLAGLLVDRLKNQGVVGAKPQDAALSARRTAHAIEKAA